MGRGGGSIEDLWAFNDERVARAIFDSEIPIISAVGHEPDVTIADYVADLRAATPSNGAELCAPDMAELSDYIDASRSRMASALKREISLLRHRLDTIADKRVMKSPENYINDRRLSLDHIQTRMAAAATAGISGGRARYAAAAGKLDALSPLKVLGRGYAIAKDKKGRVVKTASDVHSGDEITLRLQNDEIDCIVK